MTFESLSNAAKLVVVIYLTEYPTSSAALRAFNRSLRAACTEAVRGSACVREAFDFLREAEVEYLAARRRSKQAARRRSQRGRA